MVYMSRQKVELKDIPNEVMLYSTKTDVNIHLEEVGAYVTADNYPMIWALEDEDGVVRKLWGAAEEDLIVVKNDWDHAFHRPVYDFDPWTPVELLYDEEAI